MLKQNYSQGVFLKIFTNKITQWKKDLRFIKSLKDVGHIEILLEYFPNKKDLRALASLVKGYKVILHAPFIHLTLTSPFLEINKLTIKFYLQTLKIADFLKAEVVTFHGGSYPYFLPEKQALSLLVKNFRQIKNRYQGKVIFTIENAPFHPGVGLYIPSSLKSLALLKKSLPSLKFTLDIGHAIRNNNEDFLKFLRSFRDSIFNIHLHDGIPNKGCHLSLGKGEIDLPAFLNCLNDIGYDKYLTLETITAEDTRKSWQKLRRLSSS